MFRLPKPSYSDSPPPANGGGEIPKGLTVPARTVLKPASVVRGKRIKAYVSQGPGIAPTVPPWLRQQILDRDVHANGTWQCWICTGFMADASFVHIDHVIPRQGIYQRGGTTPSNLEVACGHCNTSFSNRPKPAAAVRRLRQWRGQAQ